MNFVLAIIDRDFLYPIHSRPWMKANPGTSISNFGPNTSTSNHNLSLTDLQDQMCHFPREYSYNGPSIYQQSCSIFVLTISAHLLIFLLFGTCWYFIRFDHALRKDPRFRRHQIRMEIQESVLAIIAMDFISVPITILQFNGYSFLYYTMADGPGLWYEIFQYPLSVLLMDTGIYWLHRAFHSPLLFSWAHKKHHRFIISTPFAAFAFHPFEACIMSLPNLLVPFLIPISKTAYLLLLLYGNLETLISRTLSNTAKLSFMEIKLQGSDDSRGGFHTVHHLNAKRNFGQLTTFWDQMMDTYMDPPMHSQGYGTVRRRVSQ